MSDWIGWDGLDGLDGLSYTAVTPRASLQSDANNNTPAQGNNFVQDFALLLLDQYSIFTKYNWPISNIDQYSILYSQHREVRGSVVKGTRAGVQPMSLRFRQLDHLSGSESTNAAGFQ